MIWNFLQCLGILNHVTTPNILISFSSGHVDSTVVMPLKAENLPTASFKSRFDALEKSSRQNSRSNSPFRQER